MSTTSLLLDDLLALRQVTPPNSADLSSIQGDTQGPFASRYRGHGIDFDDLRQYYPGDDIRRIDWKVTARHQQTMSRLFREERDSTITFAVDLRTVMRTGTNTLRAVSAGKLAAALAWHAVSRGQRVATLALTDNVLHHTLPTPGESGALRVCRTLCDAFSTEPSSESPLTLTALIDGILSGGRQLGSTALVTGFDDYFDESLTQKIEKDITVLQSKHRRHAQTMCLLQILDNADTKALPTGRYSYRVASTTPSRSQNKAFLRNLYTPQRQALSEALMGQIQRVIKFCDSNGVPCINHTGPTTNQSITQIIAQLTHTGVLK